MLDLYDKIQEACATIRKSWDRKPHAGIILGTGLGPLVEKINVQAAIDYSEIPHFLKSTATSHRGRLVCGELSGVPVIAMEGRFHMYEGYSLQQITLPVRIIRAMGVAGGPPASLQSAYEEFKAGVVALGGVVVEERDVTR